MAMSKDELKWDLSQLVENTNSTAIEKKLASMVVEAEKIREAYRGKVSAKNLLNLLEIKDDFTMKFEGVDLYCRLIYLANSTGAVAKQLNDVTRRASLKIGKALAFMEIEIGKLLTEKQSLIIEPMLAEYRHYLERTLRNAPYVLSEIEEKLIITKDKNGVKSWEMLQSDWLSTRTFEIKIKDQIKVLSYGEITGLYQSPDRDLRKRSNQIVYEGLGKDEIIWASSIRSVCEDHLQMCELRKYPTPMTQSLIANDVDQRTITSLMNTMMKNVGLYQKYLKLKAKLMGLNKLANYDLVAPLPHAPGMDYSWTEARNEVVDAYMEFDDEIGRWVNEMFEKSHIDSEVRKGKTSGAFCSSWLAGKSAYILQSFNGRMKDVYTLAHELGHAIHAYLYSRTQKPSNCEIGSCIAEIASTFGELLLTERLLSKAKAKEEKQVVLTNILDEFGMAAFQVSARVFFEQSMYDTIEQGKFLDGEAVAKLWVTARDKIYDGSVDWLDVMKWEWTMKPHYYIANYRFYNYPYVFAQLFVFALYRLYKEQGKSFVPKLKKLLATGSSKSPHDIAVELGFDITEGVFWEKGMKQAEEFINMLEDAI
jgi:oligoendopeptidase F